MILLTDVISQSSNFCWIVLDETTYYITAFAVDSNNAVIGTQQTTITTNFGWHPSANTLLYMPLDSQNTKNDVVGTATTTQSGTINYGTHGGVDCADFTNGGYIVTNTLNIPGQWTFLIWVNNINGYSGTGNKGAIWRIDNGNVGLSYNSSGYYAWEDNTYFNKSDMNKRFLLVYRNTSNTSYKNQYIFDGTNLSSISAINNSQGLNTALTMGFGNEKSGGQQKFLGYLSQAIFENKLRTEQEILNYIRKTKGKYGY